MGARVRVELLMELLVRVSAELLAVLGWQGTAAVVLGALVSRGLRGQRAETRDASSANGVGVDLACVATVLLAVLLIAGAR